jgi:hypothetical protein
MFPTSLLFQFALLLFSCSSFLFPSTTALPLPFAKSISDSHICLTFDLPLDIESLKFSDAATCRLYSSPSCTGIPTIFSSSATPETQNLKIACLFCEPAETFTATDPTREDQAEEASERKDFRSDLRRSAAMINGRSNKMRDVDPPQPYPEAIQAGTGDTKLTPWKPPASSWPPKESDGCGGDGPYYANGNGCIGPGRARNVDGEERSVDD